MNKSYSLQKIHISYKTDIDIQFFIVYIRFLTSINIYPHLLYILTLLLDDKYVLLAKIYFNFISK